MFFVHYLIIHLICLVTEISSSCEREHLINVGTVLYSRADVSRKCWNNDDVALLSSRYIFEDVLPDHRLITIKDNAAVDDIMKYFHLLFNVIRESTSGRTRHIHIIAMSDVIGGYIHRFVLPFTRYAYYNGLIEYERVNKIIHCYIGIKDLLRTNGRGWANSLVSDYPTYSAKPLSILDNKKPSNKSCLLFSNYTNTPETKDIPLPCISTENNPVSILLPFKGRCLSVLTSEESQYILVKYYVASVECLQILNCNDSHIYAFHVKFMKWLGQNVLPNLYTDRFYPGFGGVLRIVETMKDNGVSQSDIDSYKHSAVSNLSQKEDIDEQETPRSKKRNLIFWLLFTTLLLWILLLCIFICCRSRQCKKECNNEGSGSKRSSTTCHSTTTSSSKKCRRTTSSSSAESDRRATRKRRMEDSYICYIEREDGFPPTQKVLYAKSTESTHSFGTSSKSPIDSLSNSRIQKGHEEKSSEKTSLEDDYQLETTSTTSDSVGEEEEDDSVS